MKLRDDLITIFIDDDAVIPPGVQLFLSPVNFTPNELDYEE
jgi:hypothetical protein